MKLSALPFGLFASVIFNGHPALLFSLQNPPLPDGFVKEWDPRVGFTVPYGPKTNVYQFTCEAVDSGQTSGYIPHRLSESLWFET